MSTPVLIAPDKFKGSLSSFAVCEAVRKGLLSADPSRVSVSFPLADGGDGFAAVMKHYCLTQTVQTETVDPLGRPITAAYEWQAESRTAIIELAAASGLTLLKPEERNPMDTTTEGTGVLILHALKNGARKVILGIGGSATNDAGLGLLKALGFSFLNGLGKEVHPAGKNLSHIQQIQPPAIVPSVQWELAIDVNNPMHGPDGAAFVYAEQKGADSAQLQILDNGLQHMDRILSALAGRRLGILPGTGAAGGILAGLLPFFPINCRPGLDLVLEKSGLAEALPKASLLITGEGRVDAQSLQGKVVAQMAALARQHNIPVWVICGSSTLSPSQLQQSGITRILSLEQTGHSAEYCMQHAGELIEGIVNRESTIENRESTIDNRES